ncbi:vesicle-associated protein 1-3-like [Salvia hispanica]|uniref:vesicle-associated protein 1-3-like n=1 Tax=Salvia hispanica TaxID=49212 RepID=UPI0020099A93|nr:vesicle-associated protein 1-3-like [Salvia hispanica]XP_047950970.1 vesicle-associated protein 1-3-like [Salvia hispanica]
MTMGELLRIQPSELKFPFEVRKQSSCAMQLANKTDQYVAFKVKTTNPKRYCVRPNVGVVLPYSVGNITVTMQAHKEAPSDMQCRDKFLVQSVIVPYGTTNKDINQEMFNRESEKFVDEFKLRVIYIPANPPSPVAEEDEEGSSPGTSSAEGEIRKSSFSELEQSAVLKLKDEKDSVDVENDKLLEELEFMRKQTGQGRIGSIFVLLVGLVLGILIGYFLNIEVPT